MLEIGDYVEGTECVEISTKRVMRGTIVRILLNEGVEIRCDDIYEGSRVNYLLYENGDIKVVEKVPFWWKRVNNGNTATVIPYKSNTSRYFDAIEKIAEEGVASHVCSCTDYNNMVKMLTKSSSYFTESEEVITDETFGLDNTEVIILTLISMSINVKTVFANTDSNASVRTTTFMIFNKKTGEFIRIFGEAAGDDK